MATFTITNYTIEINNRKFNVQNTYVGEEQWVVQEVGQRLDPMSGAYEKEVECLQEVKEKTGLKLSEIKKLANQAKKESATPSAV